MRLIVIGAAAAAVFAGTPASAQEVPARIVTVTDYLKLCESDKPIEQTACLHYTRGLLSGIVGGQYLVQNNRGEKASQEVICPPIMQDTEIRDLLVKGLKEPPVDRTRPVYIYGSRILSKAMACPKK